MNNSGPPIVYTVWPWLPLLVMTAAIVIVALLFGRAALRRVGRRRIIVASLGLVAVGVLIGLFADAPTQNFRGYPTPCSWSSAFLKVDGPGYLSEIGADRMACRAPARRDMTIYFVTAGVMAAAALAIGRRPRGDRPPRKTVDSSQDT